MRAIRPAVPDDEPAIRACAREAYIGYVPLIGRDPAPMLADFATQIAAHDIHVATDDSGTLLGFVVFRFGAGHMLLENVAVRPDAAGKGVGKALIGHCETSARAGGAPTVQLYTNAKMTDNLSIYPHLGYVETDRRHEDGFDRVYFEKRLT
ncbi:acetyltransferase [Salipiger aestuarii]|uniref:Ribosomal protein S18 acetylase RimI-like enzyme n=1 Tax=Salipiger aestuarii TaxID=568098 RepID=A0A327YJ59_9RHOB|nr:GNAT family N-acetyltransferase [Salipiger aestuarii]EIE51354.1 N-acetyltransferase [Citreicella sp. 357]KAA8608575.1 acetyltransferase [Salipiger aestuarii]KAA8614175.1 acetyltransferase [Salipiger aestuarii]KAB2542350.1 acetyltransferase [Salipiger aestuarii]RAK18329.1 ribosomal protein S18 acetylase RimI-like enzyme [Salipiger aestuarii]